MAPEGAGLSLKRRTKPTTNEAKPLTAEEVAFLKTRLAEKFGFTETDIKRLLDTIDFWEADATESGRLYQEAGNDFFKELEALRAENKTLKGQLVGTYTYLTEVCDLLTCDCEKGEFCDSCAGTKSVEAIAEAHDEAIREEGRQEERKTLQDKGYGYYVKGLIPRNSLSLFGLNADEVDAEMERDMKGGE